MGPRFRSRIVAAAVGVAAGCGGPPDSLLDVPIVNGTPEVRETIREELAAFEAAAGGGRARVSRIVVQDLGDRVGLYRPVGRGILLDDDLVPGGSYLALPTVLRHELCHALNRHENHHHQNPELYERVAAQMRHADLVEDAPSRSEPLQDEVFAAYCGLGPWIALAAASDCPGDSADGAAILRQLAERVWVCATEPEPTQPGPDVAGLRLEGDPYEVEMAGFADGAVLVTFRFEADGPERTTCRDARTGDWLPWSSCLGERTDTPDEVPPGLPDLESPLGWGEGPFTGVVSSPYESAPLRRRAWHDGEKWDLLGDGCEDPGVRLFATDRQLFDLRVEGTQVRWGLAGPHPATSLVDDGPTVRLRRVVCSECTAHLSIEPNEVDELAACYGWDPETSWGPDTPPAVVAADCAPGMVEYCVLLDAYHATFSGMGEDCTCAVGASGDPAPAGCCPSREDLEHGAHPGLDALIERFEADCGLRIDGMSNVHCTDPATLAQLTGPCPDPP